ncbi:uncharacterized protein BJX67DRAFT_379819 [Aspergillus lucknowensis]|uniref:Uncharacterized protein n=1 Tax=Aspergillus lucknowensis TaxID=176173 RepID=A0ABR4LWG6_9EURO
MHIFSTLISVALLAAVGGAAPNPLALHSNVARADDSLLTARQCRGTCFTNADCCPGDFCTVNWCTRGVKAEDGTIVPAAPEDNTPIEQRSAEDSTEDSTEDSAKLILIAEDDDSYFYANATSVFDTTDHVKSVGTIKECPKKCGLGKHCCAHYFCQATEGKEGRCLGGDSQ